MLSLRSIQYVIEVARCGSTHKAAQQLYVSQPAVTHCIRSLEQALGLDLFLRQKQKLVLTPAGKYFVEEGEKILKAVAGLQEGLCRYAENISPHLDIGMSPFYGKCFFPSIYQAFHKSRPEAEINLITASGQDLQRLLLEKEIDFWFTAEVVENPSLEKILLAPEEIVLLYPKRLLLSVPQLEAAQNGALVDLRALQRIPFIMFEETHGLHHTTMELFQRHGFSPVEIFKTSSAEIIAGMVEKGLGAGFVPLTLALSFCKENPHVGYFSLNLYSPFHLVYNKKSSLTEPQRLFIRCAKAYFQ